MPKKKPPTQVDRLEKIESRLVRLEKQFRQRERTDAVELPVKPWRFLVRRRHPWRKQLFLKGRNLTARQLVGSMHANRLDEEHAAQNYRLPLDAVREALKYVSQSRELLEAEAEIERLMSRREEVARAPQPVS